jgi:hypothetical protein
VDMRGSEYYEYGNMRDNVITTTDRGQADENCFRWKWRNERLSYPQREEMDRGRR